MLYLHDEEPAIAYPPSYTHYDQLKHACLLET